MVLIIVSVFSDAQEADPSEMQTAVARLAGDRNAVPQIWINKKYIGGLGDLKVCSTSGACP